MGCKHLQRKWKPDRSIPLQDMRTGTGGNKKNISMNNQFLFIISLSIWILNEVNYLIRQPFIFP